MDRFEISLGKKDISKKDNDNLIPDYVEKYDLAICFSPIKAVWYVKIKKEDKEWQEVKQEGSYSSTQRLDFKTRILAETWCREVGLLT